MMGHTHAAIGALVGMAAASYAGAAPLPAIALTVIGAAVALVPDIDHPNGALRQRAGLLGHVAFFWLRHRGITHTAWAVALVGLACWLLAPNVAGVVIVTAYASHLLADALTHSGIYPLLPLRWRLRVPLVHISTGGLVEYLFGLAVFAGIMALAARML